jgi:hypothetical protein
MTEAEWLACEDPYPLQAFLSGNQLDCRRKCRLFSVACCRHVIAYGDGGLGDLVPANEAFADGLIPEQEFQRLWVAAIRAAPQPAGGPAKYTWLAIKSEGLSSPFEVRCHSQAMYTCDAAVGAVWPESLEDDADLDELARHPDGHRYFDERRYQAALVRDIFGNPFRPVAFSPEWRTDTALALARQMYESREFSAMPILADALQDAGCDNEGVLSHCRGEGLHVRGCWVVDLVHGKE